MSCMLLVWLSMAINFGCACGHLCNAEKTEVALAQRRASAAPKPTKLDTKMQEFEA